MSLKLYISDQKTRMFTRDDYVCQYPGCTRRAVEPAHCIGQGKYAVKQVAKLNNISTEKARRAVWHLNNIYSVCNNKGHNDYFNIHISQTVKFKKKVEEII
jgi:hypothetical protein